MKGIITDSGWTVAIWTVAIIVIFTMLIFFIVFKFQGKELLSSSIRFVDISNRPYLTTGALLHMGMVDREFIEHAIESSVVGSLANSKSNEVLPLLREFLDKYELEYYNVEVRTGDDEEVFNLDTLPRCGPAGDKRGYCSPNVVPPDLVPDIGECGEGWVRFTRDYMGDEWNTDCMGLLEVGAMHCCEFNPEVYVAEDPDKRKIENCGSYGRGVCTRYINSEYCPIASIEIEIGGNDCESIPEPYLSVCCEIKTSIIMLQTGIATSAEIPLFYKDKVGIMKVTISDK